MSQLSVDIFITGISGSSLTATSSCWTPLRTLCPLFLACAQGTPGTPSLLSTNSAARCSIESNFTCWVSALFNDGWILFHFTEWILFCSVISVCHRTQTIKPKFLLLSARKRRRWEEVSGVCGVIKMCRKEYSLFFKALLVGLSYLFTQKWHFNNATRHLFSTAASSQTRTYSI